MLLMVQAVIHCTQDANSVVRPWPRPVSMLTTVIMMDQEKMRCNNTTGSQWGVIEGWGGSGVNLSPSNLLLMPAHYQGGWPSSCKPSLHDMVINALGYRAIPPVCCLALLYQQSSTENKLLVYMLQMFLQFRLWNICEPVIHKTNV